MAEPGRNDVLAAAEELERRDGEQAAAVAQIADLAGRTDELRLALRAASEQAGVDSRRAGGPGAARTGGAGGPRPIGSGGRRSRAARRCREGCGRGGPSGGRRRAEPRGRGRTDRDDSWRRARRSERRSGALARRRRASSTTPGCSQPSSPLRRRVAAAGVSGPTHGLEGVAEWAKRAHAALLVAAQRARGRARAHGAGGG